MGYAAIYLDGGYLDKVCYHRFENRKIDYEKLSTLMAQPQSLLRAYYYHCPPYQSNPPTPEERSRYSSKHRFFTALSHLPHFQVRLGRLAFQGGVYVQKKVDCMVGVDMALLAGKGRIEKVALFSGDGDLAPAVQAVKREGVIVTLWYATSERTRPSRELFEMADERRELDDGLFSEVCRA